MPTVALCCLMLYFFETMANATIEQRISAPIKEPNVPSEVSCEQKWGTQK